jgi:hypothetical protein
VIGRSRDIAQTAKRVRIFKPMIAFDLNILDHLRWRRKNASIAKFS